MNEEGVNSVVKLGDIINTDGVMLEPLGAIFFFFRKGR